MNKNNFEFVKEVGKRFGYEINSLYSDKQRRVFEPVSLKISKWTKFRLHFAKSHFSKDTEGDITSVIEMKMLKGEMYITHTWLYKDGKLIREEQL